MQRSIEDTTAARVAAIVPTPVARSPVPRVRFVPWLVVRFGVAGAAFRFPARVVLCVVLRFVARFCVRFCVRTCVRSSARLFVQRVVRALIRSLIHRVVRSFVRSFVHCVVRSVDPRPDARVRFATIALTVGSGLHASNAAAATLDGARLSLAWTIPFVGLLASIALMPLVAPATWHRHFGKIAGAWAFAFALPCLVAFGVDAAAGVLVHAALAEYLPFVLLLFALFTVSGGIAIVGDLDGSPRTNTLLLAAGAVLANLMGTTGAAMVLVRPLIRANRARPRNVHVLVFFIFVVANAGGALTPLGDPPLFLGFLGGVSFFWTARAMFAPTFVLCFLLLVVFYALDRHFDRKARGPAGRLARDAAVASRGRLRLEGKANLPLLAAVVGCVLMSGLWRPGTAFSWYGVDVALQDLVRDGLLIAIALVSLAVTPKAVHEANAFDWAPMREVAKLFAAIFVTIVPAIAILQAGDRGALAGLTRLVATPAGEASPAMYFWTTGLLSAFLDNAPTYLVFFHLAGADARALMAQHATLAAISGGAVYMGALTYIGNAPNFMVRAIAVDRGIRMPSFFGYMAWSFGILVPSFALLTVLFFH